MCFVYMMMMMELMISKNRRIRRKRNKMKITDHVQYMPTIDSISLKDRH